MSTSTPRERPICRVKRKLAELQDAIDEAATESEVGGGAHLTLCNRSKATHDACNRAERAFKAAWRETEAMHDELLDNAEEASRQIEIDLRKRFAAMERNFQFFYLEIENIVKLAQEPNKYGKRMCSKHSHLLIYLQNVLKDNREAYEAVKTDKAYNELNQAIARIRTNQETTESTLRQAHADRLRALP